MQNFLSVVTKEFSFNRGRPLPFGATVERGGINFSIFARNATAVTLVIFLPGGEEIAAFPFDTKFNRTGDVWHAFLGGLDPAIEYAYRIDGPRSAPHSYDSGKLLADPYAFALNGRRLWGKQTTVTNDMFRRAVLVNHDYDWELDQPINRPLADSVIYELHVRGFTRDPSSHVAAPGTFRGLIEKIPYLQELGVTAVELLPVTEFDETDIDRLNPEDGSPLRNVWGYHPLSFFALKAAYAADSGSGSEIREFKDMVKAFHTAGIEVILDVVYNHSGEGDHRGPAYSFKGIDNSIYYMLDGDGCYRNYSGCGNTVNCNHPYVRHFILDSLRYWVTEMHVDGFRFDLASILGRDQTGHVLTSPPLLEQIALDPVLAKTKLIAEAWDAAGLYQVGSFPNWGRWAEWNGRFRDDVRRFVKGEPGMVGGLATRLAGSADLYQSGREPGHGINFVTSHDGFTLNDLVSYNAKHNRCNGEENNDGDNNNLSWNCGAEGPSNDAEIIALRERQERNFAVLLLLSRGVPMILAGDEFGRSQKGNNNAYCQDNAVSWLNWELLEKNRSLQRFFRLLITFRKEYALLRYDSFLVKNGYGPKLAWHGTQLGEPDWSDDSRSLAMHMSGRTQQGLAADMFLIANGDDKAKTFQLPLLEKQRWYRFVDTSRAGDAAITELENMQPLAEQQIYHVDSRSVVVLLAGKTDRRGGVNKSCVGGRNVRIPRRASP